MALSSIFVNLECQVLDFQDFKENPQSEDLDKGILLLEKYQPDLIIAIGGGSVIDMAKLMRFFILILVIRKRIFIKEKAFNSSNCYTNNSRNGK